MNSSTQPTKIVRAPRGRRTGHALKFHNFYVANERLCQSSSTRRGQRTLTHCLREEHGTKQITVSHWTSSPPPHHHHSATAQQPDQSSGSDIKTGSTESEGIKIPADDGQQQQQSILQSLLANNLLSDANQVRCPPSHGSGKVNKKANKRKPLFVRRLLPYLPNPESHPFSAGGSSTPLQDQPLDLTTRARKKSAKQEEEESEPAVQHLIRSVEQSAAHTASLLASVLPPPQRTAHRSAIKQKLEDAFRQNGFLVKTKQVSDGEATFCKFRQLRKYTRYYLKSWHKHLPDEVNKLYKGFLPPAQGAAADQVNH